MAGSSPDAVRFETEPSGLALQPVPAEKSASMLPSLPEVYRSVPIASGASVLRKMLAFAGPGYLVAVGYMDPGNWATDIGGGSQFGYALLSIVILSSLMAIFILLSSKKTWPLTVATHRVHWLFRESAYIALNSASSMNVQCRFKIDFI